MRGTLKMINVDRGFAFVKGEDGLDYFLHQTDLLNPDSFHDLYERDVVHFEPVTPAPSRGPRASQVQREPA